MLNAHSPKQGDDLLHNSLGTWMVRRKSSSQGLSSFYCAICMSAIRRRGFWHLPDQMMNVLIERTQ